MYSQQPEESKPFYLHAYVHLKTAYYYVFFIRVFKQKAKLHHIRIKIMPSVSVVEKYVFLMFTSGYDTYFFLL